jgi:uncharacterized protein YndB with AHSA1/START domain
MPKPKSISDKAVVARTGKTWAEWFAILDAAGAKQMDHKQIVAYLAEHHRVGEWWLQMVTVTYEQQRGLRKLYEQPEGFQVSAGKTIAAPAVTLYKAWTEARTRRRWLADATFTTTTATPGKSLRIKWGKDAGRLDVTFYPRGEAKTQITIQHSHLPSAAQAGRMKKFWKERLEELKNVLEDSRARPRSR